VTPNPGFKVTVYLKVEYLGARCCESYQLYKAQLYGFDRNRANKFAVVADEGVLYQ